MHCFFCPQGAHCAATLVSLAHAIAAGRLRKQYRHAKVGMMRYIFKRIAQEIWHALVYFFVLLALCLSWFIGITRFWDNVSNPILGSQQPTVGCQPQCRTLSIAYCS